MSNVTAYVPKGEKKMRMMAQTPLIESGRVFLPDHAPWKEAYLHELLTFPNARHDDQVDSTSQALEFIKHIQPEDNAAPWYRIALEKRAPGIA